MKPSTRILSLILTAVMMIPLLVSCGIGGGETTEKDRPAETESYTEANGYELAVNNYNGKAINFYLWNGSNIYAEEDTGDSLNDSTYRRNAKVEDLYNVTFNIPEPEESYAHADWVAMLNNSILSGDDAYQLVGGYPYRMALETMSGRFHNLLDQPYLDFEQEWWPTNYTKKANLGGALYQIIGNIDYSYYQMISAMVYNKEMAADLHVDGLYALVKDGKWTIDKLMAYSALAESDTNGDGRMTAEDDRFGLVVNHNMAVDAFVVSFDERFTDYDENGMPVLLGLSDHYVEIQTLMTKFLLGQNDTLYTDTMSTPEFMEGRALFEGGLLERAVAYRAMENDFGVLPYPKWDEEQEDYHTYIALGNATAYCIPITADGAVSANILEALDYFGYKTIMPAYCDKTLKGKTVRDEESQAMLELIFSHVDCDFTQVYGFCFGDQKSPDLMLRMSLKNGGRSLATEWAKNKRLYDKTMSDLIEKLG